MENKNTIYNDDVERIVNDPERQKILKEFHYSREEKKQRRLLEMAVVYVSVAVIFGMFGIFGLIAGWLAYSAMAVCAFCGSFYAGRFFENGKIKGWK